MAWAGDAGGVGCVLEALGKRGKLEGWVSPYFKSDLPPRYSPPMVSLSFGFDLPKQKNTSNSVHLPKTHVVAQTRCSNIVLDLLNPEISGCSTTLPSVEENTG